MNQTIAAVATPPGSGGVGIVRVSGPDALALARALFGTANVPLSDRRVFHAVARDAAGERLDDVLVFAMRAPRSYTGEDVVELHGHGGAANVGRLLRRVLALGARAAEPGEFTRRAFLNGKLDLTRAEAVVDVIEAGSERSLRVAQAQLAGGLAERVRELRDAAVALLAEQEARVDFPDEELEVGPDDTMAGAIATLTARVQTLADSFVLGRALRDGLTVAIVGPVNAGKSSLFNALVGSERAIVTAEPGTTRDFVEAALVWNGVPVTLIDTAGERVGESEAERRGIELSRARAAEADLRLVARAADAPPAAARSDAGSLAVMTKADVAPAEGVTGELATSAVTGAGISALREAVLARLLGRASEGDDGAVVTSERQRALLEASREALAAAEAATRAGQPAEIVALELRTGADALAEILGERVGEDMLDALFSRFCIGK